VIRVEAVWLAVEPLDMRSGSEAALARVVHVFGSARPHHAYLFANRRANRMKVLVHDGIGVWLAARRLNQGKFVWPGFGDNMRVLKWIIERVEGKASARQTALGNIPEYDNLDWSGSSFAPDLFHAITSVDRMQWQQELKLHDELLSKLEHGMPAPLQERRQRLEAALIA